MSVNVEVVLFSARRESQPPAHSQRLRMIIRPGDIAEMSGRGSRLQLDVTLRVLALPQTRASERDAALVGAVDNPLAIGQMVRLEFRRLELAVTLGY